MTRPFVHVTTIRIQWRYAPGYPPAPMTTLFHARCDLCPWWGLDLRLHGTAMNMSQLHAAAHKEGRVRAQS